MAAPETPAELCARLREIAEDGDTSDVYGNRVMRAVALIETLTSPAATPVSGAEPVAALAIVRMFKERIERHGNWDEGCFYYGNTSASELQEPLRLATAALAKPASSPAPVRPIGNQGISDYQREIARNMAEGFAAWNAARQEALPSDEPASSPAGGDVEAAAIERQACAYLQFEAPPWVSNDYSKGFWDAIAAYRQAINFRSSLSQSTSAGRVGE